MWMGPFVGSSSMPLVKNRCNLDPETCGRGAGGFRQGDPDAAMVGQETMAVAFEWVVGY